MTKIGYVRVSTGDQELDNQVRALKRDGCRVFFKEEISATSSSRPELESMFSSLKKGDQVIVWSLDRLCRSLSDFLTIVRRLEEKGATLKSLTQPLDLSTPVGRMVSHMLMVIANFELSMMKERTKLGLARARALGRRPGPKPKLDGAQMDSAMDLLKTRTIPAVAGVLGVGEATLKRALKRRRDQATISRLMTTAHEKEKGDGAEKHAQKDTGGTPGAHDRARAPGRSRRRARGKRAGHSGRARRRR